MADAYLYEPTGIFNRDDFLNWTGLRDEFNNPLTLGNAWLTESGARKVANAIGLSARIENRTMQEGWNGRYEGGVLYGPRSAGYPGGVTDINQAYWRYRIPGWDMSMGGNGFVIIDAYVPLLLQGKEDIARYLFRNVNNRDVTNALRYVIPEQFKDVSELEAAINSVNASAVGTGTVINQVNNAGGTVTENQQTGSNGMADTTEQTYGSGDTGSNENPADVNDVPGGFNVQDFMDKKVSIGGMDIPLIALAAGVAIMGLFLTSGGKD